MKNIFKAFAIFAFGLSVVSCGGDGNSAEGVAKKFLDATNKVDMAEAKKYTDESAGQMIDMMSGYLTPEKKAEIEKMRIVTEIISTEEKDSTAEVKYKITDDVSKKSQESKLSLKKVKGEWKVTMSGGEGQ